MSNDAIDVTAILAAATVVAGVAVLPLVLLSYPVLLLLLSDAPATIKLP